MITGLIQSSLENTLKRANPNNLVSQETLKAAKIPSADFIGKLKAKKKQDKTFLINDFQDVCWVDPFPNETKLKAEKQSAQGKPGKGKKGLATSDDYDDEICVGDSVSITEDQTQLVYPESRYLIDSQPACIYLPTNDMILTMMRASILVEKPEDLWINNQGF